MWRYSERTAWDTRESALSQAIREHRAAGLPLIDLTISNPTVCGFDYGEILAPLQNAAALTYDPDPKGMLSARETVAAYYADHGAEVDPDDLILTTSTSEAYSFLFRLLCDPGDAVLVAQPSYPLFDFLATLDDVRLEPYPLFEDFGWWIDFAELERRIGPRTRAIVLVHPNNPTGHATSRPEREQLEAICVRHDLALIVDEVFLDYSLGAPIESFAVGPHPCPTFVVSGLSKIAALPQMKVGWIASFGRDRAAALARLDIVADTFLSMNAPSQLALPVWLAGREGIRSQVLNRVRQNVALLAEGSARLIPVGAGWSAILKLRQQSPGETLARRLIHEAGIIVHPGSFYGMAGGSYIVVSLIGLTASFAEGVHKLNNWCESNQLT